MSSVTAEQGVDFNQFPPPAGSNIYTTTWQPPPLTRREMDSLATECFEAIDAITNLKNTLTQIEALILEKRLFHPNPTSFQSIGKQVGQTGESIRRTQKRFEHKIDEVIKPVKETVELFRRELDPIIEYSELDKRISDILACFTGNSAPDFVKKIIVHHLNYSDCSNLYISSEAQQLVKELKKSANSIADDVGLIDENALKHQLPNNSWEEFWPMLLQCCKLHRIGEHLALRDTARAQVKAALLTIGRPATKEEIASLSQIPLKKIGGQLSIISSITRSDKQRWGLAEWIDDEYEGITAEIIQRINEDDGATKLSRLLDELPRLFGVSESSVRTFASTPQFHIRDGYVSLADTSSISLRHLDDVIEGYNEDNSPYWSFIVEDRYFDGHSLAGFPPELANALGCKPNESIRVKVDMPLGCRDVSISWRLSSISGPSLGYLSDPLRKLGAVEAERVLLIVKSSNSVEFRLANSLDEDPASQEHKSTTSKSDFLLERIKNRRRVL